MSGTINPQLNNLLGLPMGLGPTPGAASLAANTAGIDPTALGQLYRNINQYVLQGTDPGISHSLLGGAASLYPDWSPMHQLAGIQAQHIAASDAAAAAAAQAPTPQPLPFPGQDVHGGAEGTESGESNTEGGEGANSYASGGLVRRTMGNAPAPDAGYISANPGEYVMQRSAVNRYGPNLLGDLNAGRIDPQQLQRARR